MIISENSRNNYYYKLEIWYYMYTLNKNKKIYRSVVIIEHDIRTLVGITHETRLLDYL